MISIIEGGVPRSALNEGRQHGFGSTFLKKIGVNKYQTLFGITTCKDYLHDVLAAEHFNCEVGVYGLTYTKSTPFRTAYAYMAISMLNSRSNNWPKFAEEQAALKNNIANLTAFLNACEEKLKIQQRTKIYTTSEENVWLVKLPKFWVKTTYLISLYTLLLRIGYHFNGQQNIEDYVKVLLAHPFEKGDWGDDIAMFKDVWPKIEWLSCNHAPSEDFDKRKECIGISSGWHNYGIMATVFVGDQKTKWLE